MVAAVMLMETTGERSAITHERLSIPPDVCLWSLVGMYPNLRDRAAALLVERARGIDEDELACHLFGGSGAAWATLLRSVLGEDERFERSPEGRWHCRSSMVPASGLADAVTRPEFVALAAAFSGPKPWRHRLVGLWAFRVSPSGALVEWGHLFHPGPERIRLPSYLARLGIDPDAVSQAPPFGEVASDLVAFLAGYPLVGLDVGLTVAFLQYELRRLGLAGLANHTIELAELARRHARDLNRKPTLDALASLVGLSALPLNSLGARGRLMARVAARLLPAGGEDVPVKSATRATTHRWLLDSRIALDLPAAPGVYLFRSDAGEVLYVGKARHLAARLTSYLTSEIGRTRGMVGLVEVASDLEVHPTSTELEASLLEARLIALHQPRYNVQRRPRRRWLYLGVVRPDGRRPRLGLLEGPVDGAIGPLPAAAARGLWRDARDRWPIRAGPGERGERARARWQGQVEEALAGVRLAATGIEAAPGLPWNVLWPACALLAGDPTRSLLCGPRGFLASLSLAGRPPTDLASEIQRAVVEDTGPVRNGELAALAAGLRRGAASVAILHAPSLAELVGQLLQHSAQSADGSQR